MSIISDVRSKDIKAVSLKDSVKIPVKKSPAKNIFFNMKLPVRTNPIDSKRVSKESTNSVTKGSLIKAGLIFLGTVGAYYLAKTTNILSYFGWGAKNQNLKDISDSEIVKVKNRAKALSVRMNLETERRASSPSVNQIKQTYKEKSRTVKFEEIKVEEFKDLLEVGKKENVLEQGSIGRRSTVNPTFKGSYDTPGFAHEVALSGNYAYVADWDSGLQIIDVSDPSNPTFKGSYDTPLLAYGVALSGNYAYVADEDSGLRIIDISDPANPTFKGAYNTPGSSRGVALSGNYAYLADDHYGGLQVIDISDPSNPIFIGSYDTPDTALGVAISGNYAYVADKVSGLQIIDISDLSNPTFKGSYDTSGSAHEVVVSGNYAYVVGCDYDYSSGFLQIIDINDPSNPTFKGSYNTPKFAFGVAISGNYAYVAGYTSGLQIIDICDPANPTFKGSYDTPGSSGGVAVSGNYAYVADGESGLQIIAINILTDLAITLIIIGSITGAVCTASFCCVLIGGGIVVLRRYRNKDERSISAKEQKKEEGEQKS